MNWRGVACSHQGTSMRPGRGRTAQQWSSLRVVGQHPKSSPNPAGRSLTCTNAGAHQLCRVLVQTDHAEVLCTHGHVKDPATSRGPFHARRERPAAPHTGIRLDATSLRVLAHPLRSRLLALTACASAARPPPPTSPAP